MTQHVQMRYVGGRFRGYPIGTIAYYGPNDRLATRAVVSVLPGEGQPVAAIRRWSGDDLINDGKTQKKIREFLQHHRVRSILVADRPMPEPTPEDKGPAHATAEPRGTSSSARGSSAL